MSPESHTTLGTIAVILAFASFIPYFRDIFRGTNKPHAFSWLIWGLLMSIGFAGQTADNAGPGAWAMGISGFLCFAVSIFGFTRGEKDFTLTDKLSLLFALLAIPLWLITSNPTLSVIVVTVIDALGYIPTIRKTLARPHQETLSVYWVSNLKLLVSLTALEHYSIATAFYPLTLVLLNSVFVGTTLWRRRIET